MASGLLHWPAGGMTGVIGCSHINAALHVKISVLLLLIGWHPAPRTLTLQELSVGYFDKHNRLHA